MLPCSFKHYDCSVYSPIQYIQLQHNGKMVVLKVVAELSEVDSE